jgi:DHA2 family multidrug resistance protein
VGIALSATLVQRFMRINRADLAHYVTAFDPDAQARLHGIASKLMALGSSSALAQQKALAIVNGQVTRQALMLAYEHIFLLFGASLAIALPLLFFMRTPIGSAQRVDAD